MTRKRLTILGGILGAFLLFLLLTMPRQDAGVNYDMNRELLLSSALSGDQMQSKLETAEIADEDASKQAVKKKHKSFKGDITYYANCLEGNKTASGEPYDGDKLTAAHRTLPLGSKVKVKNLENNKEVVLKVNDRGPFASGKVLDVSRRAAKKLALIKEGTTEAKVEVLSKPKTASSSNSQDM